MDDQKLEAYAIRILNLAKDNITVRFRFFDSALARLQFVSKPGLAGFEADAKHLYFDSAVLVQQYMEEPAYAMRLLLHVLFHGIFLHPYRFEKTEENYWNIASDIAVENVILNMDIPEGAMLRDSEERLILNRLTKWVPSLTADAIYREFMVGGISKDSEQNYARLFAFDRHRKRVTYKEEPQEIITQKDWEKIAERVKADLKSFSKDVAGSDSILMNLKESTRKRYNYDEILRKFATISEEIKVNPDEFDYIYYTYGLQQYHNMPLIEPLEYTEDKRIRDFVIAIDTSASVQGKLVESFLHRTYDILTKSVSFSTKLCVHVIQCDMRVTSDIKITSRDELAAIASDFHIKGQGATDFRPVFAYVEELEKKQEFTNLKGLIYFTDGYGIYPDYPPKYDCMFVFPNEDDNRVPMPGWAIKVVLEEQE